MAVAQKFPRQLGKFRPSPKFRENRFKSINEDQFTKPIKPPTLAPSNSFESNNFFTNIPTFNEEMSTFGKDIPNIEEHQPSLPNEYLIRGGSLPQHSELLENTFGRGHSGTKSTQNFQFNNYLIHHKRNIVPKEGRDNIQIFPKLPPDPKKGRDNIQIFPKLPQFHKDIPHEYANIQPTIENFANQFKHEIPQGAPYKGPIHVQKKPEIHHKPGIYKEPEVYHEHEVYHEPVEYHKPDVYHEPEVYHEHEVYHEPVEYHKPEVYYEPEVYQEHEVYHEPLEYHKPEVYNEPEVYHEHEVYHEPLQYHKPEVNKPDLYHEPEIHQKPEVYHGPEVHHQPPQSYHEFQDEFVDIKKPEGMLLLI